MKRIALVLAVLFLGVTLFYGAPVYSGAEGYITMPRVDTASAGRFGLGLKYTYPRNFTVAANIVPLKFGNGGLEFGFGYDFVTEPLSPLLANMKLQFVKQAALGLMTEIGLVQGAQSYFTVYFAWEETLVAGKLSDSTATFALGYTFDRGTDINFFVGIQRQIFIPQIFLIADISNFPYKRHPQPDYANESRGIFNLGLRFIISPAFSIDICGLDLMDSNRSFMVGGNLYLSLWGGRHK
jgi:hypothetical protein